MSLEEQQKTAEFFLVNREDLKDELKSSITELISELQAKEKVWITTKATMELLSIKSHTTMQSIRNNGLIEFSQPMKKLILYKRESVLAYLERHSQKPF